MSVDIIYQVKLSELMDSATLLNEIYARLLCGKVNAYYHLHGRSMIDGSQFLELYNASHTMSPRTDIDLAKGDTTTGKNIPENYIHSVEVIKFYEKWELDKNGNFTKTVKKYFLMFSGHDDNGNFSGYVPILEIDNRNFFE